MRSGEKDVVLLSFKGCPNAGQAKENLKAALIGTGLSAEWKEVDLESSDCPEAWRGFPSPTILVEGVDVLTGEKEKFGKTACRSGGAPPVDRIAAPLGEKP